MAFRIRGQRAAPTTTMLADSVGRCLRRMVLSVNLLIALSAVYLFGIGIWAVVDKSTINYLAGSNLFISCAYVTIITSILILILTVLGLYAAHREIRSALIIYCVLLLLVGISLAMGAVVGYVFRAQVEMTMPDQMMDALLRDYGFEPQATRAWDIAQRQYECCSVSQTFTLTQWMMSRWYEGQKTPPPPRSWVPATCCKRTHMDDGMADPAMGFIALDKCQKRLPRPKNGTRRYMWPDPGIMFTTGCLEPVKSALRQHSLFLAISDSVVVAMLAVSLLFAFVLFRKIGA